MNRYLNGVFVCLLSLMRLGMMFILWFVFIFKWVCCTWYC